jgi:methanogenic corrinoid protein MtbC1
VRSRTRRFLDALLKGDPAAAYRVADEEFADVGSRAAVFADLIHPAQYEIGDLWYRGLIGVADEHRATALVETIAERLPPTPTEKPLLGCRCVLAAVGAERHVIGLRLLAAAMADDGWEVVVLGDGTPVEELLAAVDRVSPQLVGLSAGYLPELEPIKRVIRLLKERRLPVLVGGAAFNRTPSLVEQVGADAHGTDARVALTIARRLVGR